VAAAPRGGLAIVVPPQPERDVQILFLPDLKADDVHQRTYAFLEASAGRWSDRGSWLQAIDRTCEWLWPTLMQPVLEAVAHESTARFTLIPCGWLGMLPLHAAWSRDDTRPGGRRYALDDAIISYAPNACTLATAERRAASRELLDDVLVVDNPTALPGDVERLQGTRLEAEEICRLVPGARVLAGGGADSSSVLQALGGATLAHIACHGQSVPEQPLKSGLLLAGGVRLKVHEVMARRMEHTRLAVLSACETAVVGRGVPDEAVGLPSAILQAGGAGVVASLWAVPDRSTTLLMRAFYRYLLEDRLAPDDALRHAQRWLRDATNDILARASGEAPPVGVVTRPARRLWEAGRPYFHPYHWAAFTFSGA
jgi:CHAT domain-containing protein